MQRWEISPDLSQGGPSVRYEKSVATSGGLVNKPCGLRSHLGSGDM